MLIPKDKLFCLTQEETDPAFFIALKDLDTDLINKEHDDWYFGVYKPSFEGNIFTKERHYTLEAWLLKQGYVRKANENEYILWEQY